MIWCGVFLPIRRDEDGSYGDIQGYINWTSDRVESDNLKVTLVEVIDKVVRRLPWWV